ncbi:ABC transporter substrate-binding protein/permease [Fictibacillus enclensis]|uniref:ABC transporter substrate-binding protein/permease n=1 Tax=Fictibacillus enclensis TaxID=1017270 RepID=UPI0024C02650|nr:ABC transporter substrate-binding protein/permease [Fictibacillus enclensis]WHY70364.1 ABC transporter substrate-binding protein/permease [Fictibacillus enclensis]
MFKKTHVLLTLALLLIFSLAGNVLPGQHQAAAKEKHNKTLVMGTSADYAPYEYIDTAKGNKIIGFDVDVARHIADKLGYNLVIKDMDFNGLVPALDAKRVDFVMAGMTPNAERKQKVDFSDTYYKAKQLIVTNDPKIKKIEDLKGKAIGVQLGSIQEKEAKKIADKVDNVSIEKRNKVPDLVQEIMSKRFNAAVIEDGVAIEYLNKNPDLSSFVIPGSASAGSAVALQKGSDLTEKFNKEIAAMKKNGELDQYAKKWFEPKTEKKAEKKSIVDFSTIMPSIPYILKGILTTLKFVVVSILLGFVLGTILALFKISKVNVLRWGADAYTSIFRGTPLILQLLIIYNATPQLTGYKIEPFLAGVLTFGLNSAAYVSEIIRAGINGVDKGQREASMALGVSYGSMMRQIILPQALKNILPALMNEFITLTKESAIIAVIGTTDIMRRAQIVGADTYRYFEPLITAGIIYYLMVMALTVLGRMLERRMSRGD